MLTLDFEQSTAASRGWTVFCGVDEAGRGPLAGPVCAAAVVLGDRSPGDRSFGGLNDSKKLTEKRREALFDQIIAGAKCYSIQFSTVEDIERDNILQATLNAMRRAVAEVHAVCALDGALIDGDKASGFPVPAMPVVGGDARCPSIAAASILAKVSRDRYMKLAAISYPEYGFDGHKGYGSTAHFAAIDRYGLCAEHRPSFLTKHFQKSQKPPQTSGKTGETVALDYLKRKGWHEVARNHHSTYGEIDLIVENAEYIAFVEVKLRDNSHFARACEFVDERKQAKLRKTAELWLAQHPTNLQPRFDVVEVYLASGSRGGEEIIHIENAF